MDDGSGGRRTEFLGNFVLFWEANDSSSSVLDRPMLNYSAS